jgi:diguanylate cyclase (GGDEF)-like protein
VLVAPSLWLVLWTVPAFQASIGLRVIAASLGAGVFCLLAAAELARGRRERLPSRGPTVALLASYGCLYLARIPFATTSPAAPGEEALATVGLVIMCFAAVLYTVALAFVFIALTKERAEGVQRLAAETDSLTGAVTRRAFAAAAEHRLKGSAPAALIVFDLDHFKRVNDTYGHAAGDAVLAGFAEVARVLLPPGAVLVRLGGEEFACLAEGLDGPDAARVAERVRGCIAATRSGSLPGLAPTVSVGVATTEDGRDLDGLMRRADAALYRAKNAGRNRVECAGPALAA